MKTRFIAIHAAVLAASALWVALLPAAAQTGPGFAIAFSGASDYVEPPGLLFTTVTNSFTMELWVNPTASRALTPEGIGGIPGISGQRYALFPQHGNDFSDPNASGAGISVGTNGVSIFEHAEGFLPSPLVLSNAIVTNWTHVAVVYSNGLPRLYLNGGLVRTGLKTGLTVHPSVYLSDPGDGYGSFQGQLDEVRIWNAVRSPVEIQTNLHHSLSGTESNLVAYWRLNEGSGTETTDTTTNIFTSFLVNMSATNWVLSTVPFVPDVVTSAASDITATNATLHGMVHPGNADTRAWFQWGTDTNYGHVTTATDFGSGSSPVPVSLVLTGLQGGAAYHFRIVATNVFGLATGTNADFAIPALTAISSGLPGVSFSAAAWGDFDNDGRLDILITGQNEFSTPIAQVWKNNGDGTFSDISAGLTGVYGGSVAWGDYDNDGRLDLLLTGLDMNGIPITQVWRNTGSGFTYINAGLPGVSASSVAWGDYDNDGRLDILVAGLDVGDNPITQVWRNTGSGFADINAGLPGVSASSVAWGDYDNDGRLDMLLAGQDVNSIPITQVWRNTGSGFANASGGLTGVFGGSVAWGDYDNDGRLDILLSGRDASFNPTAEVWRNTGSGFSNINAGLTGVYGSSGAWGDYNNDGRLDILLTGRDTNFNPTAEVWRNTGSGFSNINAGLTGIYAGSGAWGDYDNDGRLDILLVGSGMAGVWRNQQPALNSVPAAPTGLVMATFAGPAPTVTLSWNAAIDGQTPGPGLSYNLRVGTTPGSSDVLAPMASSGGFRRLPELGNAQTRLTALLPARLGQTYYWSVQAVDSAFAGSPFAADQHFTLNTVFTPPNGIPVPGDTDGDGVVSQSELDAVLANYWSNSLLFMTNIVGLGKASVQFALTNASSWSFSMFVSTNLTNWNYLGPTRPIYQFTDPAAATNSPQRFYRLRWP